MIGTPVFFEKVNAAVTSFGSFTAIYKESGNLDLLPAREGECLHSMVLRFLAHSPTEVQTVSYQRDSARSTDNKSSLPGSSPT